MNNEEINVLAMIKGEEQYVFLYNDANRIELLRTLGRYAADPQLSFNWYDAAFMSKKVRELAYEEMLAQSAAGLSGSLSDSCRRFSFHPEEDII
jgi:hypothetical protein